MTSSISGIMDYNGDGGSSFNHQMQQSIAFTLTINDAQKGVEYKIPVGPGTLIQDIKQTIFKNTGMPQQEQVLIVAGENLGSGSRTLESYNIIQDRDVFLLNRTTKPEEEQIKTIEIHPIPQKPQPKNFNKDYETSPNPIARLYGIEFMMENQLTAITHIKNVYEKNYYHCANVQKEISIQVKSLNFATNNLRDYYK